MDKTEYYLWRGDGECADKSDSFDEAKAWADADAYDGVYSYVEDGDRVLVYEPLPVVTSINRLLEEARGLFEGTTEHDNPEYLRGMSELLARICPLPGVPTDQRASRFKELITTGA